MNQKNSMMKNLLNLIVVLFISTVALAQGPKIEFKEETINYGTVTK
jgi:hypothetical protein